MNDYNPPLKGIDKKELYLDAETKTLCYVQDNRERTFRIHYFPARSLFITRPEWSIAKARDLARVSDSDQHKLLTSQNDYASWKEGQDRAQPCFEIRDNQITIWKRKKENQARREPLHTSKNSLRLP